MTQRGAEASPQTYARVGGLLYLFIIVAAAFGELFVRNRLIVWGDASATADNILGAETLFRVGLASEMLTCACDVALAVILYALLRPVDKHLALLGAFYRVAFVAFYSVSKLFEIAALAALGSTGSMEALTPPQLHDLAYVSLRVHDLGYGASMLFFGLCCVLFGVLIHRSGYFPRIIGALLAIAGVGYVVFSLAQIVSPGFAARVLFPPVFMFAFVAELALCLWLLIKGVDVARWHDRTQAQSAP